MKLSMTFTGLERDNESGKYYAKFEVPYRSISAVSTLENKSYDVEVTEHEKHSTNAQKALLWSLIGEIDMEINGSRAEDEDLYCQILEMAGAKIEYVECTKDMLPYIRKSVRALQIVEHDGDTLTCKCVVGVSKMSTKQMQKVIDTAITYAENVGIPTDYWLRQFERSK